MQQLRGRLRSELQSATDILKKKKHIPEIENSERKYYWKKRLQKVGKIANQIKTNIGNRGIWETNRKIKQLKEYKTRKMETKLDRKQNG